MAITDDRWASDDLRSLPVTADPTRLRIADDRWAAEIGESGLNFRRHKDPSPKPAPKSREG